MQTTNAGPVEQRQPPPTAVQSGRDIEDRRKLTKMRVMVAIDESNCSFYALRWALDHLFVGPTHDDDDDDDDRVAISTGTEATVEAAVESHQNVSMVTLVHVVEPFQHFLIPAGPAGPAFYGSRTAVESLRKAHEEKAAAVLSRALKMCKNKMIKAQTLILNGDAKDMICQATEQMHVDLLVVGSRGLGMVKRAFLGSVSDYCAHHATCPVVIVKPPKDESGN